MNLLALSDPRVASTDSALVPAHSYDEHGGTITSVAAEVPAGTLHAYWAGDFTMTLCGASLAELHPWTVSWTGHPAGDCCRLCLTALRARREHQRNRAAPLIAS